MNLLQAIEQAGDNWFRPVSMSGNGIAFTFNEDMVLVLVEPYGEESPMLACFESDLNDMNEFGGKWEIVTPDQVKAERDN